MEKTPHMIWYSEAADFIMSLRYHLMIRKKTSNYKSIQWKRAFLPGKAFVQVISHQIPDNTGKWRRCLLLLFYELYVNVCWKSFSTEDCKLLSKNSEILFHRKFADWYYKITLKETPRLQRNHLLEVLVTVNVFLIMGILQLICFDVLPESLDDSWSGLRVYPQQAGQAWVQFELRRLQHNEKERDGNRENNRHPHRQFQL